MLRSTSPAVSLGEERGLLSQTVAGNRPYRMIVTKKQLYRFGIKLVDDCLYCWGHSFKDCCFVISFDTGSYQVVQYKK